MAYFPVFINISKMNVLIVGAGAVGCRRIKVLLNFGADITVITKEIKENIDGIKLHLREYCAYDIIDKYDMVIASTDNDILNSEIIKEAKKKNIKYYNNAGSKNESNFFFPAVIEKDDFICGLISKDGSNHKKTAEMAEKLRNIL